MMTISKGEYIKLLQLKPSNNNNNNNNIQIIKMKPRGPPFQNTTSPNDKDANPSSGPLALAGNPVSQSFILVPQQQLQQNVVLGQTVFQTSDGKKFMFMSGPNKKGIVATKVNVNGNYIDNGEADKQLLTLNDVGLKDKKGDIPAMGSLQPHNGVKQEDNPANKRPVLPVTDCVKIEPKLKTKITGRASPVESKRRSKSKQTANSSTNRKVISLFRSDVPPPPPHTPESGICTFHEHTLVRMATRGFWGGDRGPIQDVFRTIRTDVGDQTFTAEDITRCCYNLVKQKLEQATNKDTYYMYMKGYVDEFDGVMNRVYPVTTIAMMVYLPMAEDYASTTWHGVPPTGWSEYRRAVIMREVFEVMFKFGHNSKQQTVPEYKRRYFENTDTDAIDELICRPYVPCWDCSAQVGDGVTDQRPIVETGACDSEDTKKSSPARDSPQSLSEDQGDAPIVESDQVDSPSPSIITSEFAEDIVSACSNSDTWTKPTASSNDIKPCPTEVENTVTNDDDKIDLNKEMIILKTVNRSRYFSALWLGKAPKEAEILFEDGTLMKISRFLEEYPLEKSSPPRDTKIIVGGKTYNARDVLGHFRRGVQLVEHSYNTVTNSNTTSTLKGTIDGGIVRKVPPYKISKLIHPGLHLETYTSRILSIADEESGLVKRSIRRARSRFRRSTASPVENESTNAKQLKRLRSDESYEDGASSSPPPIKTFKPTEEDKETRKLEEDELQMRDQCIQTEEYNQSESLPRSDPLIHNALISALMTSLPSSHSTPHDVLPLQALIDSYKKTGEFLISLADNLQQTLPNSHSMH